MASTASASGRVNLIGEHTDYNEGFVLPMAIPQRTTVEIVAEAGDRVHITSHAGSGQVWQAEYVLGQETRRQGWMDYVQGVTWVLKQEGREIGGFRATISSEVPMGSGLSSSAALEVAILRALRETFGLDLDDVRVARLGQRVENDFVGARVGIMDQMAASLADETHALFLDTRDLSYRRVPVPLAKLDLLVINSGIQHRNVGGGYNERRAQCEEACRVLGVRSLRELSPADLERALAKLSDVVFRRVRHVVTENARVLEAVAALENCDLPRLGGLFRESHASMRDDYEVSIPEMDRLVEIACAMPEVYGARLTGGGFGGSMVVAARKNSATEIAPRITEQYRRATGQVATVLVPQARNEPNVRKSS